jgi:hypothetical protein
MVMRINVTVRFIKYCVWSYAGKLIAYKEGELISTDDKTAQEMVKHNYAVFVEDGLNQPEYADDEPKKTRKMRKATENKMLDIQAPENKEVD